MSNHLGDTNKMVETPRTDAKRSGPAHFMGDWVDANFACQLERELNAANAKIKRLEEQLMDVKNKYAVLVADVALYEDRAERIKRLEKALTEIELAMKQPAANHMMQIAGPARQVINIIKKAKEAKL